MFQKKIKLLITLCAVIISSLIFTACYDPLEIEDQEAEIIDTTNLNKDNLTEEIIITINNTPGTAEDKELYPEKYDTDDPFNKEDGSRVTYDVDFKDIKDDTSKSITISKGDLLDIYIDEILNKKLIVTKIPNRHEILISIDGQSAEEFAENDKIEIRDPYFVKISSILYNDEEEDRDSNIVTFDFYIERTEHYPQYLIEKTIGLHDYIRSRESSDSYMALYSDVIVTVEEIGKFAKMHPNRDYIILFESSRVYKEPGKQGVFWMTILENKEFQIHVNSNMESVIRLYLDKFPSYITDKTHCRKSVYLDEREEKIVEFEEDKILIIPVAIIDSTMETKISFNSSRSKLYQTKDVEEINDNVLAIIDDIQINYVDSKDRVKICLV